tara:strand:- start:1765 stop:2517 length:753 start_codon:yes stop_codon:yes gene_type:complete
MIIEFNGKSKIDVEISSEFTGKSAHKQKDYHPLFTRQNVSSSEGRTNKKYWPNRTSVAGGEAVDYYNTFYQLSEDDVKKYYGGDYPRAIADLYSDVKDGLLTNQEQNWVKEKLQDMLDAMGGNKKDLELLVNYLYFKAVYYDDSDQCVANYLQNINNIRMICNENNVKLTCFTMHGKPWLKSQVYKDAYEDKFKDIWLFDDDKFELKSWVWQRFGRNNKDPLADSIHYYPWVFKTWIEEMAGPWLKERFI